MPYSYPKFKTEVAEHILEWTTPETMILDIGAGCGTYAILLNQRRPKIDGIEVHKPYVDMFGLMGLYRSLFIQDIREFGMIGFWDYFILGDVLEHLSVEDATRLLKRIDILGKKMMVAVPYRFEQGEEFGNVNETHLQPDLTKEIFLERYPMMRFFCGDDNYGYFINYNIDVNK